MFEEVKRQLKRLEQGTRLSLDFALDGNRYLDRMCPNGECGARFKVQFDDLNVNVRLDAFYCPICGLASEATEWNTPEQVDYIKNAAFREIQRQLGTAFEKETRSFNRSQRSDGFISMTMSYKPTQLPVLMPPEALDVMSQQSTCEQCGFRYASVGAAFFCPACGHNSSLSTFDDAVNTVRRTMAAMPAIRDALLAASDENVAEDAVRHTYENSLVKLVSSFQRFADGLFDTVPGRDRFQPRRNVFQNLAESSTLWRDALGKGYEDMLTESELALLERYFQQRHVLVRRDGIVDEQYLERSGDVSFEVGQRLVVRSDAIESLADLVEGLAATMRSVLRDA